MDSEHREKLVDFIQARSADLPWPRIEKGLLEQGYKAEEIAEGVDAVFPSKPKKSNRVAVRAGLFGAIAGIVIWLVFALIYRSGGLR